jgi:hypothetical protein
MYTIEQVMDYASRQNFIFDDNAVRTLAEGSHDNLVICIAKQYLQLRDKEMHSLVHSAPYNSVWYPDVLFECCNSVAQPDRAHPYRLQKHCKTITHLAHKWSISELELSKAVSKMDNLVTSNRKWTTPPHCHKCRSYLDEYFTNGDSRLPRSDIGLSDETKAVMNSIPKRNGECHSTEVYRYIRWFKCSYCHDSIRTILVCTGEVYREKLVEYNYTYTKVGKHVAHEPRPEPLSIRCPICRSSMLELKNKVTTTKGDINGVPLTTTDMENSKLFLCKHCRSEISPHGFVYRILANRIMIRFDFNENRWVYYAQQGRLKLKRASNTEGKQSKYIYKDTDSMLERMRMHILSKNDETGLASTSNLTKELSAFREVLNDKTTQDRISTIISEVCVE